MDLSSLLRRTLGRGDIEAFLDLIADHLPGQPGNATRKNYLSSLRVYLRWAAAEGRPVLRAGPADAQAYRAVLLQKHPATPATVHNHLARVRTLYDVLAAQGAHPGPNPFLGLLLPSNKPEEHRDLYTPAEINRLLAHGNTQERALVLLGAHAGLTGPQTVNLRWEHLDLTRGELRVGGRSLELSSELGDALHAYGREQGQTELFRTPGPMFRLENDHQLRAVIYALCRQANVPYKAWRALRNAAGLRLLLQTGNPQVVADRLGLTTLKAVEVWQKLAADRPPQT
ncbi:site-specific integrase [Deinococcus sp. YIM 77859]|uniref:tyrosine-type recombinase/integrase n=1 Tax=Deinococcus sp. YIM 77859 TaxID=1540221 RepID=UPI000553069D|nr:site-specific integrase [Deinococcus sp. YIM 77859]